MKTRKPPVAPKLGQPQLGPVEGQQISLECHTSSPRKLSTSDHGGMLGSFRPRSPRPAEVYNAAMAELTEGDGRGLTKIKTSTGVSPVSSPSRRRAISSIAPLSPAGTSILDHNSLSLRATMAMTASGAACSPSAMFATTSARLFSVLEEQRMNSPTEGYPGGGSLPNTPPRKATSAPDSQYAAAQLRGSVNPWRTAGATDPTSPLSIIHQQQQQHYQQQLQQQQQPQSGYSPPSAAAAAHSTQTVMPSGASGSTGQQGSSPASGGTGAGGGGWHRRESASSTDSHSPGVFDSPVGVVSPAALRIATLVGRTGSPGTTPSTPSASSQPHTPTAPGLRPRPPGEAPTSARSRKFSHLASPDARQYHQQQLHQQLSQHQLAVAGAAMGPGGAGATHGSGSGGGAARQLSLIDEPMPPPAARALLRSTSVGGAQASSSILSTATMLSATASAAAAATAASSGGGAAGSQPGTPSSPPFSAVAAAGSQPSSRPSSSRAGSARTTFRPVAVLVDAIRSRDDAKLAEVLEALRNPLGMTLGLNELHHVTCRTPLHEAAMSNSTSMVGLLLAAGADPNMGHPTQGPPLLHCAAFGEVEAMHLLLTEGADVNAADVERSTALHFACKGGHVDSARLLIKFGADVRARDEDGMAPFDLAAPEMLRMVLAAPSPPPPRPPMISAGGTRRLSSGSLAIAAAAAAAAAINMQQPLSTASSTASSAPRGTTAVAAAGTEVDGGATSSGGSSRKSLGSGGGRPPSGGSPTTGPVCSPNAVQLDMMSSTASAAAIARAMTSDGSGGGACGSLRPAPPSDPHSNGGASGLRSRRASGTISAATITAAVPAAPAAAPPLPPPPPTSNPSGLAIGLSPLNRPGTTEGGSSSAGGAACPSHPRAPASPLLNEGEAAPPPVSPPTLQLPGGVRRQLSRGAVLGDIISAFQQEDVEMVRRSQPMPSFADAGSTAHATATPAPAAAAPLANASAHVPVSGNGVPAPEAPKQQQQEQAPQPQPAPAAVAAVGWTPVGFTPPPSAAAPEPGAGLGFAFGTGSEADTDKKERKLAPSQLQLQQQQQPKLLPFALPETSILRFGTRLRVHGSDDGSDGADKDKPADANSADVDVDADAAVRPPSFSAVAGVPAASSFWPPPPPPQLEAVAPVPAPAAGFNAAGFVPVPATGFTPRFSNNGGNAATRRTSNPGSSGGGLPPLYRVSGFGDDSGAPPPPPLMRDSSPVRDRAGDAAATTGTAKAAGKAGVGGGGGGRGGGVAASGRHAPTRTSQLAAVALKRMSVMEASMDAIEARAAAMFRQSTDLTTGELAWTRGELLGEGAYGKVYAGLNQQTGELMAVKVLQLLNKHGDKEAINSQLDALQHEMSLYKKLKHKHVVGYIDACFDPKTSAFFIFLEYVPGGSIASMLTRFKRFSEELVRNYTRQLLGGLEYLHGSKIVHRDLKGANVLVTRDGVVKLADFGASKAYRDHTITDCMKSVRGSVFWMAPEVIRGTGYGRRADIWSLGCTVIEMLTGTHPWPHLDNQWTAMFTIARCEEGPPRPANMSEEAARFLDRCLQFDPAKRPTAAELLQDPFVARLGGGGAAANEERLQHSF